MRTLWQRTFKFRVAFNMLFCALVFGWFGSLPRETISGFLGRRQFDHWAWGKLAHFVDSLHVTETDHCERVAFEEELGWRAMYPEWYS